MGVVAALAEEFRESPWLTAAFVVTVVGCLLLLVLSAALLVAGDPRANTAGWLAVVAIGVAVVSIWNVAYPLWDRFAAPE